MLKETLLAIFVICFVVPSSATKKNVTRTRFHYPELFRDHVYKNLTEKGREMFYAVNIHPLCKAKKGQCIPRARCHGKDMLYISRICYKRDLVCCYDNSIRFPEVADGYHTTKPSITESTRAPTTLPPPTIPLP